MDVKVWILISGLHKKPADLDLDFFKKRIKGKHGGVYLLC